MLAQLDGPEDNEYEMGKIKILQKAAAAVKKVVKKVATISAAPSRIAFLGLVRINLFGLAKNLAKGLQTKNAETKKFWTGLGGDPKELVKIVNLGAHTSLSGESEMGRDHNDIWEELVHPHISVNNKSPLVQQLHSQISEGRKMNGCSMGVAPAAAAAAATPILVAVLSFLKKNNIVDEKTGTQMQAAIQAGAEAVGQDPNSFPVSDQHVVVTPKGDYAQAGVVKPPAPDVEDNLILGMDPKFLIGGAAILAVGGYLLMKK